MSYVLGQRSKERLVGVHPDLARVVKDAIRISETDFTVIEGVRTQQRQIELYAQGRTTQQMRGAHIYDVAGKPDMQTVTWTLNSNHFVKPATGYGHAVDLAPYVDGKIEWTRADLFKLIAMAMKIAAKEADVPVEWGYDLWGKDMPHFQLPAGYTG